MPPENDFAQFLTDFRATVVDATARLRELPAAVSLRKSQPARWREIPAAESRQKSGPDVWAQIEILGHLVDSAANNHQRFVRSQFSDDLVYQGYEQNQWVSSQKYADESWPELIQLWSSYNLHLHHVVSVIPA